MALPVRVRLWRVLSVLLAIAWRLAIRSIRVDGIEQLAEGAGPFLAEVFSEVAFGVAIAFPPAALLELELERSE